MSRVLLFGGSSILGWNLFRLYAKELVAFCPPFTEQAEEAGMNPLHLESREEVVEALSRFQPEILIHCGGICDVEKCEENSDFARKLNVDSVRTLLDVLSAETRLVYVSNDHVFGEDGSYDELSEPSPISYYGACRVEAEKLITDRHSNHLIVRHGLPLGTSLSGKNGHQDWLKYRLNKGLPVTIVEDESRSVVCAERLARRVWSLAHANMTGLRHIPSRAFWSRPVLAKKLKERLDLPGELVFESRSEREAPHLGRIELRTIYEDDYAEPISAW